MRQKYWSQFLFEAGFDRFLFYSIHGISLELLDKMSSKYFGIRPTVTQYSSEFSERIQKEFIISIILQIFADVSSS